MYCTLRLQLIANKPLISPKLTTGHAHIVERWVAWLKWWADKLLAAPSEWAALTAHFCFRAAAHADVVSAWWALKSLFSLLPQFCVCTAHIHDEEHASTWQVSGNGFGLRTSYGQNYFWLLFYDSGLIMLRSERMVYEVVVICLFSFDMSE